MKIDRPLAESILEGWDKASHKASPVCQSTSSRNAGNSLSSSILEPSTSPRDEKGGLASRRPYRKTNSVGANRIRTAVDPPLASRKAEDSLQRTTEFCELRQCEV